MVGWQRNPPAYLCRKFEAPSPPPIVNWILEAWGKVSWETIKTSSKSCALNLNTNNGSEDDLIHCFKEKEPCKAGREILKSQLSILTERYRSIWNWWQWCCDCCTGISYIRRRQRRWRQRHRNFIRFYKIVCLYSLYFVSKNIKNNMRLENKFAILNKI